MQQETYTLFGQRLVERGIITQQQLDEAIHKQQTSMNRRKLGEILVRLGYISKSHIVEGLADQLGIPIVKLSDREIPERIRNLVDPQIATLYRVIPIGEDGDKIILAMADPTNINNIDNLERLLDRPIEVQLATPEDIASALSKYYGLTEKTVESMLSTVSSASTMSTLSTMSNVSSMGSSLSNASSMSSLSASDISLSSISVDSVDFEDSAKRGKTATDEDEEDTDSPVLRYVHNMITEAFRLRASDIHIEPGKLDVKVRYRIDGVLHLMPRPPKRAQPSIISRLKIMAGMDISERRIPQDGRIKITIAGKMLDLRVSCLPSIHGETIVMRILDKTGLTLGLGQLGFSPEDQQKWEELLKQGTGVMLVTGPTGSGKTTTLYASLHKLNNTENKLITIEDPVEYMIDGINQVQINHEIGWDFARALRAIFRMDPDVVMVGEIRDLETADIAIKAALTGHLVFTTLHTNDAPSAFIRLVDIGTKPFLVAAGVRVVLAQRLVRTICSSCKEPYKPTDLDWERLAMPWVDRNQVELFWGKGCEVCNNTGYQGRVGVYELLLTTDRIRTMIMEHASANAIRRQARLEGMHTLREDAWQKALNGITTIQEVIRVTTPDEPLPQKNATK
ncbi:MAG TPA: ATPase, T2SS/T4P/T4SS family [Candidatus Hydrogenedentes bacterium]|nr:ATPase, T2SS/T4P/T4SS family [Candidatus Hydrogenedentota bacterium]HPO85258.1 ATPase, T2SS/T4P/T4SS family [Candidatus Hydrogenedentota bacterium]